MKLLSLLLLLPLALSAQDVRLDGARLGLPAGGYSGITRLPSGSFAMVSDRPTADGHNLLFLGPDLTPRGGTLLPLPDLEDVAYDASCGTLWIASEGTQRIVETTADGALTGRELTVPSRYSTDSIQTNRGFEALCYDSLRRRLWTCTEAPLPHAREGRVELLAFLPSSPEAAPQVYPYTLDAPRHTRPGRGLYHGIAALAARADGTLLVLEREAYITRRYLRSSCRVKLYVYDPATGEKRLQRTWTTRFGLLTLAFANYEGMTLTPEGLLLVADSQGRYGRGRWRLRDYLLRLTQ